MLNSAAPCVVLVIFALTAHAQAPSVVGNAAVELSDFELHPALEIALFAQEPEVVDPVALTFDEDSRAYVVEMRDYPFGFGPEHRPGGTVRLLEDLDGDGRADRSTLFAEDLSFPTSITAWDGGVLVMASPEVLFLKDTDGDRRADVREVVLAGFKLGVTDSNASGLRYGPDNWIHGVNGGNGGALTSPRRQGEPMTLGDRDFRFRPATGEVDLTFHTGGGFGLVFDDWGRSFTPHNINHVQQRILDADDLRRFPGLPPIETTHSISDHGEMARIFPISPAQTRPNHPEQAGHFSAAGGMGYIGHRDWPAGLPGSVLVCDVVGNLVHRDVLVPDGPILRATRAPEEQTREFLACRDNLFRPVGLEPGPDGALYLLDMHREVIEHPDYIPKKMLETQNVRAGDDRGRIYRVAPKGWTTRRELPGSASPEELVRLLASPNPWTRVTAQRLIVTRSLTQVAPALREMVRSSPEPTGRLHALWTLDGLGALDVDTLVTGFADASPRVRANAVSLARPQLRSSPTLGVRSENLLADPDAEVRFQAALAAGDRDWVRAYDLRPFLLRDHAYPWSRRAALSSLGPLVHPVAWAILGSKDFQRQPSATHLDLARELAEVMGATSYVPEHPVSDNPWDLRTAPPANIAESHAEVGLPPLGDDTALVVATLEGFSKGLARRGAGDWRVSRHTADGLERLIRFWPPPVLLAAQWKLTRQLGLPDTDSQQRQLRHYLERVGRRDLPTAERAAMVPLLGIAKLAEIRDTLTGLLDGLEPSAIQTAAFQVLREHREPEVATLLISAWPSLSPTLRPSALNLLVYRRPFHAALLDALDSGRLQIGELNLDLEQRRQLLRRADPEIRERAAKWMSDEEYSNRQETVERWLREMPDAGDPVAGRATYERLCAQCHQVGGLGFQVGPDLTGLGYRSVEDLVSNILDPNMAMNPNYAAFTAELSNNEEETGILGAESASAVTLHQAQGRTVEIPRSQIRAFRSSGRSLMPEGLEAGLTPRDLRDLVAFLQLPVSDQAAHSRSSP